MALLTHIMAGPPLPAAKVWGTVPPAVPHGSALTFTFLLGRKNHRHLWAVSHLLPPWAQPLPFMFSSHYFRQLFAWKPWELQPDRATIPPGSWHGVTGWPHRLPGAFSQGPFHGSAAGTQPAPRCCSRLPPAPLSCQNRVRPSLAPTGMSGAQQSTLTSHRACKPKSYKTAGL